MSVQVPLWDGLLLSVIQAASYYINKFMKQYFASETSRVRNNRTL